MLKTNSGFNVLPIAGLAVMFLLMGYFVDVSILLALSIGFIVFYVVSVAKKEGPGPIVAFAFLLIVLICTWASYLVKYLLISQGWLS